MSLYKSIPHTFRKEGIYYFNRRIPKDLKSMSGTPYTIKHKKEKKVDKDERKYATYELAEVHKYTGKRTWSEIVESGMEATSFRKWTTYTTS